MWVTANSGEDLLACVVNDAPVADDDDDVPGGPGPWDVEGSETQGSGGAMWSSDMGDAIQHCRHKLLCGRIADFAAFLREAVHDGKEEDLHIIYRNIEQLYSS